MENSISVQNVHEIWKISNNCFECFDCFNSPDDSWCIIYLSTPWNLKILNELNDLDRNGTDFTWFNSQTGQLEPFMIEWKICMSFWHLLHLHGVGGVSCDGPRPFPPMPVTLKSESMNLLGPISAAVVFVVTGFISWVELSSLNTKYPFTFHMKRHITAKMIRSAWIGGILTASLDLVMNLTRKKHRILSNCDLFPYKVP